LAPFSAAVCSKSAAKNLLQGAGEDMTQNEKFAENLGLPYPDTTSPLKLAAESLQMQQTANRGSTVGCIVNSSA
jgi:hypothetical protein